jgi:hypothetical protein
MNGASSSRLLAARLRGRWRQESSSPTGGSKMIIDTNSNCLGKAQLLKSKAIDTVGRNYRKARHPEWAITKAEAQELSRAGIRQRERYSLQSHNIHMTKRSSTMQVVSVISKNLFISAPDSL